jgi:hypothetical protein
MSVKKSGIFTKQLTNADSPLVITDGMGVRMVSIFNGTGVNGTYLGGQSLLGLAPSAIDVEEGETATVVSGDDASVIDDLTISAPAGCTLKIIAIV